MQERQAVTREYKPRYHKASKKSKQALLDEFTRLTSYHRKSAVRLLAATPPGTAPVYIDGKPVKLKPGKKRPANRKGKRIYSDEAVRCLRLVWTFFWYKCGQNLWFRKYSRRSCGSKCPLSLPGRPSASLPQSRNNCRISLATIDRHLRKDKDALKPHRRKKPLQQP